MSLFCLHQQVKKKKCNIHENLHHLCSRISNETSKQNTRLCKKVSVHFPRDLKSFPSGPGANEAFWLLSHILHIFQFGQAITPSGLLSRAKPNSPLFLFICICSVQSWLLPPALQLFLERRDSLNEFR